MTTDAPITFVDLSDTPEDHNRLARFFNELFVPGFPDPDERETLDTLQRNLIKRTEGFYGANNYRIVLGLDGELPVAACIADYMVESNCGALEYLLVSEDRRGEGLGKQIHDHTTQLLMEDARNAGKPGLNAIMLEINDPYQVSAEMDNVDPFDRTMMWHNWGYKRLRFPYEQPALSDTQAAVGHLLLGVKILNPALAMRFPATLARQIVVDYLVWANRFDSFDSDPFFRGMTAYAEAHNFVPVERLDTYIGRNPDNQLTVRPLSSNDYSDHAETISLCHRAFGDGAMRLEGFAHALSAHRSDGALYHVWAFSLLPDGPVAGMTSFYSLTNLGVLEYLVLEPPLQGQGLARVAIKRIEERLIRDRGNIRRIYAKCAVGSQQEAAFRAMGFQNIDLMGYEPIGCQDADGKTLQVPAIAVMCKTLGDPPIAEHLAVEQIGEEVKHFLRTIGDLPATPPTGRDLPMLREK